MAYDFDFELCVVCLRVADMPTPRMPSVRRKCTHCHAPIWVAKGAPSATKACLQCVTGAGASVIRRRNSEQRTGLRQMFRERCISLIYRFRADGNNKFRIKRSHK
jgi:hypothetical protein